MFKVKLAFNKAVNSYNANAFLQKEITTRLDNKLNVIKANTNTIVDLGAGTGFLRQKLAKRYPQSQIICIDFARQLLKQNKAKYKICANANQLPLIDSSVDIIASNLMLQWCPQLDRVFEECFRVINDNGLILFSTFGPNTLKELKKSWAAVDDKPHVNNFIDMHHIGDLMLQKGFCNPVMEMETLTIKYQNVVTLMRDLKKIGAQTVANRQNNLMGKNKFQTMLKMYESYRQHDKLPATFEVIYGHAWKKTAKYTAITVSNTT